MAVKIVTKRHLVAISYLFVKKVFFNQLFLSQAPPSKKLWVRHSLRNFHGSQIEKRCILLLESFYELKKSLFILQYIRFGFVANNTKDLGNDKYQDIFAAFYSVFCFEAQNIRKIKIWKGQSHLKGQKLSSDIIRIRLEKIQRNSLFELKYEFEYVRIITDYSNSKLKFE